MWDFENGPFTAGEKAAMHLASRLSNASPDHSIPSELLDELRSHFADGEIMELSMTIAVLVGMARMLFSLELVDEEPGCPLSW